MLSRFLNRIYFANSSSSDHHLVCYIEYLICTADSLLATDWTTQKEKRLLRMILRKIFAQAEKKKDFEENEGKFLIALLTFISKQEMKV